jgi:hypothetical protein
MMRVAGFAGAAYQRLGLGTVAIHSAVKP